MPHSIVYPIVDNTRMDNILPDRLDWAFDIEVKGTVPKATHQSNLRVLRTKSGRWFVGKTSTSPVLKWMREVRDAASKSIRKPNVPLAGPLAVLIEFTFERPKSRQKKGLGITYKTCKPDLDNAAKAVIDAIGEANWWADDAQIAVLVLVKKEAPCGSLKVHVAKIA